MLQRCFYSTKTPAKQSSPHTVLCFKCTIAWIASLLGIDVTYDASKIKKNNMTNFKMFDHKWLMNYIYKWIVSKNSSLNFSWNNYRLSLIYFLMWDVISSINKMKSYIFHLFYFISKISKKLSRFSLHFLKGLEKLQ